VLCDARGRTSLPGVYAVGDASSWWHPLAGRHVHVEHWTTTTEHAATVAKAVAGAADVELAEVPYFWSDQFGVKIQALGFVGPAEQVHVSHPRGRTVVLYGERGRVRGVVGFSAIPEVMRCRALISGAAQFADAVAAVGG
jgi:3-phenylpropionate/trans-cinnamate dioxygenase ferredoxin reductase subunit